LGKRERRHRLTDDDDSNDGDFDGGKPQYWSLIYHFTPAIKQGENYRPAKGRKKRYSSPRRRADINRRIKLFELLQRRGMVNGTSR